MGDGGVACVPSQHIMDQLSICGGKNGTTTTAKFNSSSKSSSLKFNERKMKMKAKREELTSKRELGKSELGGKQVANGRICAEKVLKEEVEEGELGSLKWPEKGEVIPTEKPRKFELKSEIEKGEISGDKWRKEEVEKGEFVPGKWRKGEARKGEFSSEKADSAARRVAKDELEKGEFVPERWRRSEVAKDEYGYSRIQRHDSAFRDKGWKYENERTPSFGKYEHERTPPSGRYSGEKDFNRSGSQHIKRSSRYETSQDRTPRIRSKIVDEEGSFKNELSNGKDHGRQYSSGNRLKRNGTDSDSCDRKRYGEFGDYAGSKSRRFSDDSHRGGYSDHYSRRSVEKSYKNASSLRNMSFDKYSSRYHESSMSTKVVQDKYNSSPRHSERSPRDRAHYHDHRDRSPVRHDRSPNDRSRHYDCRNRSPSYSEQSPQDQARYHDHRDWTPNFVERSPLDRERSNNYREASRRSGGNEKGQSHYGGKGQEEKHNQRDPKGREPQWPTKESVDKSNQDNGDGSFEKNVKHQCSKEEQSQSPNVSCLGPIQVNGTTEELPSMEEDMDICDTPPHTPVVADSVAGKWFYLDHFGVGQGPSRLCDLKTLVEEGFLVSDHLVKHSDCDRWMTVENAVSPMCTVNLPSIVSDTVTQMVSPPEAPGNLLADVGDVAQSDNQAAEGMMATLPKPVFSPDDSFAGSEPLVNLQIDERVRVLLEGFTIIPGRELETVGEVLQMKFQQGEWERWGNFEGEHNNQRASEGSSSYPDFALTEPAESRISALGPSDKDIVFPSTDTSDWFSGRWSCKGGDWKINDEIADDRPCRRKLVLNDGYSLCQMPKSGYEDPRWHRKDELYNPSHSRRLDLPSWAFTLPDELNDGNGANRSIQTKPVVVRGLKGAMLPVIRINACVVKDHGSFVSEPRMKVRGKDRYSSRSSRPYSAASDTMRSSEEGVSHSKNMNEQDSSTASISIPKDRLCTADDLHLHFGHWYYLDGAGHERGPLSFSELQVLADQGIIQKQSSVFRKIDKVWVPVTSVAEASETSGKIPQEENAISNDSSGASHFESTPSSAILSSFNSLHPQFIGYTRGKLHELVMKSYKSREFAAAINEVLDPWINARQPKKEIEKFLYNQAVNNKFQKSDQYRSGKRARLLVDGSEEEYEMEDLSTVQKDEYQFDDLYGDATFCQDNNADSGIETGDWGLLDGRVLARVLHFLRSDMKSLVHAGLTCKRWRSVVNVYKDMSRQVDFSSIAHNCTDSMICNIMKEYNKEKVTSLDLRGCTSITSGNLEEIIQLFSCLSSLDIRGCTQFEDLAGKFPNINWIKTRASHSKIRSLKHVTEKIASVSKIYNGLDSQMEDSSGLRDYLESLDKRDSSNQLFRRSLYKRSKVFGARKSSSILSRDAHLRRWAIKKAGNGYKKMEEFLAASLKDILKKNTFDFFVPKVAEIEEKMKNGYYAGRGLSSVKGDIITMCRDAIKAKNLGDNRNMNHIIKLFIRLATSLEDCCKSSYQRDEMMKTWKDDSPPGFASASLKYKKNLGKGSEKKYVNRSNGSSFVNGGFDHGEYTSDREIKRRLSKLNKKSMDSGSETSDDLDRSSEDTVTDSESTASDTESDLDLRSEGGLDDFRGNAYITVDDGLDSLADEREWGARMTKSSLVPPVTRKYEVIDHYVIVADEEEVQRKMQVSLPEDYIEKLNAQKNGTEESDMEIPEVKAYKPRKQLGDEVIEQEVYGIDPYTHNLLLDSMPEESDWSLLDKHVFIEDVFLRTLNKQVRNFTGIGNTPMKYHLRPVVEEILATAEEDHDRRTVKLCQFILKAIDNRHEDNYVAYRKGLGVVCNKERGFGEDDFVVEFLGEVYPAWKWFEKQDGIRSLQKNNKDPAPEFYNIYLERPKGDADGYDLVVVDAMHKANYASRICHSCRPNCEAKVTAVDGQYQIGIYSVRPIGYGEEITFDYNSVTESKEEYEASVCLCGSQVCRGSYLNLTGEGAFQKVLKECHRILDRYQLMLEACELNSLSEEDYIDLGRAGLGSCLLGGLPEWLIAYSARLVRFINYERTKLPEEILRHNLEEKKKYFADICLEVEKSDAEVQAEGVYNQRLQNLALTLDKVRYVMRCVFGDPKKAPPPLEKLSPEEAASYLWKGEGSFVEELIQCMVPHMEEGVLNDLKSKICGRDPSGSDDIRRELRKSLLWLRDEVRNLPCTHKCRHDAAADLIHIYAYTKCFYRVRQYRTVTSEPVYISPLDLGPKFADKLGSGVHEYSKTYGENYCLGQLIYWHSQTNSQPDNCLVRASRGCLSLPDIDSFYAKVQKPSRQRVYGPRTVKFMLARMEKQSQRPWPKDRIWSFNSPPKVLGSPMLDAVLENAPLDKEMVHWLKHRPAIFQAGWDR
ncbi:unnamed protein product [Ilex paraguariensis]|uniref:SET domain-containing protein n=1 Tax=Ilex paraguariensis TaxID=185542 RepID=A0ABC8SZV6_9AQUA